MTERSILIDVANGDSAAVTQCIDRFGGLVWSIARRMMFTEADAEDAVQEIFVEIWKNAHRFDPEISSESTFIALIARRRLIDRLRKTNRKLEHDVEIEKIESELDSIAQIEINEEAARALEEIRKLPPEQSKVLIMAVYHGMSHSKIAEATGMPLGTVKTHVRRGLIRLRDTLMRPTA